MIKTKAQHVNAHKKLWNLIIKKTKNESQYLSIVKCDSFRQLFDGLVVNLCFGCHWARNQDCRYCLFEIEQPFLCLNGLWKMAFDAYYGINNKAEKIRLAKAIRDFPVKKIRGNTCLTKTNYF